MEFCMVWIEMQRWVKHRDHRGYGDAGNLHKKKDEQETARPLHLQALSASAITGEGNLFTLLRQHALVAIAPGRAFNHRLA